MKRLSFALVVVIVLVGVMFAVNTPDNSVEALDYSDHTVVLAYAEIITDPASGEAGRVEWFRSDLGNAQLSHDFVYGDPRRSWNGSNPGITYAVNTGHQSSDANLTNQIGWMYDSIFAWDNLTCSNLGLSENATSPANPGLVYNYFNGGGLNLALIDADLTQVGFYGAGPLFAPGTSTLGVTYTLFWVDGNGNYTDIDNNGKYDAAFREIYYNDQYDWSDNGLEGRQPDGSRYFDLPSVAIHEVGHGFSQAHFGNIGIQDEALKASPHTIMNAIYGGIQRELTGRDIGGHCSNWAQWPNK